MLIHSLFPHNGFLPSIVIPLLQRPRSQYEKKFTFFFFKERLLMYVSKTGGLVSILNTLNLDIVKEVICWGGNSELECQWKNGLVFLLREQGRA